jgi:hypothetical protein
MLTSLNSAVREVLGQGGLFLDLIGDETCAPRSKAQRRPALSLWEPTTGTSWIIFSAWRKGFGLDRSTTISGAGTRNWRIRWCARLVTEGLIDELGGLTRNASATVCCDLQRGVWRKRR